MNWYKTKLAFPIRENDEFDSYTSVGHDNEGFKPVVLYLVDKNLKLYMTDERKRHEAWSTWWDSEFWATGRYDPNTHNCSITFDFFDISIYERNYIEKTIIKILDKAFNNPTILTF